MHKSIHMYKTARQRLAKRPALCWAVCLVSAVVLPLCYQSFIEFQRTASVYYTLTYLRTHGKPFLIGAPILIFLFFTGVFLTKRLWLVHLLLGGTAFLFGTVNRYKLEYRAEPLMPRDFLVVQSTLAVMQELSFSLRREMLLFGAFLMLGALLLGLVPLAFPAHWRGVALRAVGVSVCISFALLYAQTFLKDKVWLEMRGMKTLAAGVAENAYQNTTATNFLILLSQLTQPAPEAYNKETMAELEKQMREQVAQAEQNAQETPMDIVVVLLESYFPLEGNASLLCSESLTAEYDRLAKEGISGKLFSEYYGGGTANVEFSVMTGFSAAQYPVGFTPFIEKVAGQYPGYPRYLQSRGYETYSLHSYRGDCYARVSAYPALGIAHSQWEEDFENPEHVGNYIGEVQTMQKLTEVYEKARAENDPDTPLYLHCVTMQNHVPYAKTGYAGAFPVSITAIDQTLTAQESTNLGTLASNIRDCDIAIGWLCDYFKTVDREVLVVFFGDHQADTEDDVLQQKIYAGLSAKEYLQASHTTPYLIWNNHASPRQDVSFDGYLSPFLLLPLATHAYGAPRPFYFSYLARQFPVTTGFYQDYFFTQDGSITVENTAEQQAVYEELALLQYDTVFGKRYATNLLFADATQGTHGGYT